MPLSVDKQEYMRRWEEGFRNSGERARKGVEAVKEAPGKKAAAQKGLWLQNIQKSADRWERNTAAVSLQSWQESYIKKGIPAMANSIETALPKVDASAGKLLNAIQSLDATVPKRVADTKTNIVNRVGHYAEGLKKAFGKM